MIFTLHLMTIHQHMRVAEGLAKLMDNQFKIFGFRVGLDPILGLIPGLGDLISLAIAVYFVIVARFMKVPDEKVAQMVGNIMLDFIIGSIPILGDFGDFVFKANTRNLRILREYAPIRYIEGEIAD